MYTIYALKSAQDNRIYVSLTKNLTNRLKEHNSGYVFSTKAYRPWHVIYTELAENRVRARVREKYFKSGIGKEFLKSLT